MNKRNFALLKAMLLSSSSINKIKYSTDKKGNGFAIGNLVGKGLLYILLMAYCILMCIGYGQLGLTEVIPAISSLMVAALAFIFTIIKTNGYLFNFKEYDMLMALPYRPQTIAACKFLYMYVQSVPWYISISIAMMIGYGVHAKASIVAYSLWIVLTFVMPIIPMLAAAFIGFVIAKISSHFRKTNVIQSILMFAIVIFAFSLRFIIEAIFKEGKVEVVLENAADVIMDAVRVYTPAKWFVDCVVNLDLLKFAIIIVVTVALFWLVFITVGKSYRQINSAFQNHGQAQKFEMKSGSKHNVVNAIAFKEFRRYVGSSNYLVNCGIGEMLSVLLGLAVLCIGFDKVIATITQGAPLNSQMLVPAIPLIVYFLIGMVSTTTCSPSLEGKNYWIVQSLPISKKTLYLGKMLFNMYLTVPFAVFATLCLCISAKVNAITALLSVIEIVVLCAFSTTWGMVCGIKFIKLQWENELEVIKQGAAVAVYMFPNMFVTIGMVVLVVFLGTKISPDLICIVLIGVGSILTIICYLNVIARCEKC